MFGLSSDERKQAEAFRRSYDKRKNDRNNNYTDSIRQYEQERKLLDKMQIALSQFGGREGSTGSWHFRYMRVLIADRQARASMKKKQEQQEESLGRSLGNKKELNRKDVVSICGRTSEKAKALERTNKRTKANMKKHGIDPKVYYKTVQNDHSLDQFVDKMLNTHYDSPKKAKEGFEQAVYVFFCQKVPKPKDNSQSAK